MNHQPFENWLYHPEQLDAAQTAELQRHLETCSECRQVQTSWQSVQQLIAQVPPMAAPAGFVNRFNASLVERRKREHRRQARNLLLSLGILVLLITLLILIRFAITSSPAELLGSAIQVVTMAPQQWIEFQYIFSFWVVQIPPLVFIVAGLILVGWTLILVATSFFAITRIKYQGVTKQ